LKSALYSLSMQPEMETQSVASTPSGVPDRENSFMSRLSKWFNRPTPLWAGFATAAVIAVTVSVLLFNYPALKLTPSINIASYQDSSNMRFIPRQKVPGIGFFSAANNYAKPYDNLQISITRDNQLQLQWKPVDKAIQYQLSLYRYRDGNKQLVKKVTTGETHTMVQLQAESFNQRFEWTLSGSTSEQVAFITSGGFVISQ
jgi:hypothetical protein